MSDDASPSSTAPNETSTAESVNVSSGSRVTWNLPREHSRSARSRAQLHPQRRKKKKSRKKRNPGLARKLEFVTHLLRSLDTLVFAELSGLYYMEYVRLLAHLSQTPLTSDAPLGAQCFDSS